LTSAMRLPGTVLRDVLFGGIWAEIVKIRANRRRRSFAGYVQPGATIDLHKKSCG